jgi:hypothetical protein
LPVARTEPVLNLPSSSLLSICSANESGRLSKRMPLPPRPATMSL